MSASWPEEISTSRDKMTVGYRRKHKLDAAGVKLTLLQECVRVSVTVSTLRKSKVETKEQIYGIALEKRHSKIFLFPSDFLWQIKALKIETCHTRRENTRENICNFFPTSCIGPTPRVSGDKFLGPPPILTPSIFLVNQLWKLKNAPSDRHCANKAT